MARSQCRRRAPEVSGNAPSKVEQFGDQLNQKDSIAAEAVQAKSSTLKTRLEAECEREGVSLGALTVLANQNDPYRADTPAGRIDGAWFAEQIGDRTTHLRGLHYSLVVRGDVLKPNGRPYVNSFADWSWLSETAAKAARWLGFTPFDQIVDNRNDEPEFTPREAFENPRPIVEAGFYVPIPYPEEISSRGVSVSVNVSGFFGRQPYNLVFFGEKSSLGAVLRPLCRRYQADLFLPTGEISDTLIYAMAKRGAEDGRVMVVFTLSDFDPAGFQMPVSIGRKLQALRDLEFPDLNFEVVPVALTAEQAVDFDLPSTPLKETERRADRWREAFGREQTEIDALQALRPGVLREIVEEAVKPYFDDTLDQRVWRARDAWETDAWQAIDEQIGADVDLIREGAAESLGELRDRLEQVTNQLRDQVEQINADLVAACGRIDYGALPPIVVPEPQIDVVKKGVLCSSDWSWAEMTRALIRRKRYGGEP